MGAVTKAGLGREFDRFLYASVGDDGNGMPLTVLSALARMDVDPWEEAATLMQLPQSVAVQQLGGRLCALRHVSVTALDPARLAVPLVALLPRPLGRMHPVRRAFAEAKPTKSPATVATLLSVLTYVIFMLFGNLLMGNLQGARETHGQAAASAPTASNATAAPTAPAVDSTRGARP